jgi:uncharacterized protein
MFGFGARAQHYAELLSAPSPVPLVEFTTENLVGRGGRALAVAQHVRRDAALTLHGVSMQLGGLDPLNDELLNGLSTLMSQLSPSLVSDHLCFGGYGGLVAHDLWPLPFSEEAVSHVATRIRQVQDRLGCRIAVENVSAYVALADSTMPETEFLAAVAHAADCWLLLDLNNLVVNGHNFGFDPSAELKRLDFTKVKHLHLAGHSTFATHRFDDHGGPVHDEAWALFRDVVAQHGPIDTTVEWDENLPSLERLTQEAHRVAVEAPAMKAAA